MIGLADVAQLVERAHRKRTVAGSNPAIGSALCRDGACPVSTIDIVYCLLFLFTVSYFCFFLQIEYDK